jgi:hypothetical protein
LAHLINLKTFTDTRGSLTVIERVIPFEIKRIFYVNDPDQFSNDGYQNKSNTQAVICLKGSCSIVSHTGSGEQHFVLNAASQCLVLDPGDRHRMQECADGPILMVLSSEAFEPEVQLHAQPFEFEASLV